MVGDALLAGIVAGGGRDLAALLDRLEHDRLAFVGLEDVARGAAHQAAGRGQRAQHDPLVPEILDDVGVQPAVDARLLDRGIELDQRGARRLAVALAEGDRGERAGVQDLALVVHGDADAGKAAHHLVRAELGVEHVDMAHAVQQRHDGRVRRRPPARPRRSPSRGRRPCRSASRRRTGRRRCALRTVFTFWVMSPLVLLMTSPSRCSASLRAGAHEEGDVGAALVQPAADIAADRAGAEDQDFHLRPARARRAS